MYEIGKSRIIKDGKIVGMKIKLENLAKCELTGTIDEVIKFLETRKNQFKDSIYRNISVDTEYEYDGYEFYIVGERDLNDSEKEQVEREIKECLERKRAEYEKLKKEFENA
jgi:hypothetical protein